MAEIIFGIDHGNGNMKGETSSFPCGIVRYTAQPGRFMNEDILEYEGAYYTLSETKMPFKADKTVDDDYFILTLFTLVQEARKKNINLTGKDVVLGVGLPPADFGQQAVGFKQYFIDHSRHGISFRMNDKPVSFYLKDVFVSPQNFAAVMCFKASLLKKYRTVNCIDIGDGTVDLLVIRNGKPDLSVRVSERSGMAVLRSEISNRIQQNYGIHLDSSDVEQVLMGEETILEEEIIKEIYRMADDWVHMIINKLHAHVTDFRTNPAIFLGGGSLLLKKQIEQSPEFKYIEFIDDVKANAIGYEKLAAARIRRGLISSGSYPRDRLKRTQTPQGFRIGKISDLHRRALKAGITNSVASCTLMIEMGEQVYFSVGSEKNIKLTTVEDIDIFKALLIAKRSEWLK